ncbi:MAG: endonuclease/exonuclease/phosphatase family protein [Alkalispirochaeta sp.]|jgi:endonuclease/exonuclease/phosphatase family metal-dependent hydrolase
MAVVMTYNLHGCVGTDGRYLPRRNLEVIQEVTPDILGLQEVRRDPLRREDIVDLIREAMPEYHVLFCRTLSDERGEYGNAVVSRYPVGECRNVRLEGPPENRRISEARRAIFAHIAVNGLPWWVVVTHLGVEPWARWFQSRRLVKAVHRHTGPEPGPTILMGDMNGWYRPNSFLRYRERMFSRQVVRRTFPSRFPVLPLDRMWMSRHFVRQDTWVHRSRLARRASDHLPLCVRVVSPGGGVVETPHAPITPVT